MTLSDHQELLVDYHLGLLEPTQAEEFRNEISASRELQARSERCRRWLRELDAYEVPSPPADLTARVLERIAASEAVIPFASVSQPALPTGLERAPIGSPILSIRELLAIAACIVLFVGIFVPGYYKAQAISKQHLCRENLYQIAAAAGAYQAANAGYLPHAGVIPDGSWLRVRVPGVPRASNTRHIFKLLRDGYVTNPRIFLCPADESGLPMKMERPYDYRRLDDFAEAANFTYSSQNANTPRAVPIEKMARRMAYVADANPYFGIRRSQDLNPFRAENSHVHDANAGQNVLYVSGDAHWVTSPAVGVNNDNIYLAGSRRNYTGTELPVCETDSFLIP